MSIFNLFLSQSLLVSAIAQVRLSYWLKFTLKYLLGLINFTVISIFLNGLFPGFLHNLNNQLSSDHHQQLTDTEADSIVYSTRIYLKNTSMLTTTTQVPSVAIVLRPDFTSNLHPKTISVISVNLCQGKEI